MNRTLIATAVAVTLLGAGEHLRQLHERVEELESNPEVEEYRVMQLERQVELTRRQADAAREEALDRRLETALARRYLDLDAANQRAGAEREDLAARLGQWEEMWEGHAPERIEGSVDDLRAELERRVRELDEMAAEATRLARADEARLAELSRAVEPLTEGRDVDGMWHELVGPVVQLAGEVTVGSGVLLESRPREGGGHLTYMITSWHVVRDIYGSVDRMSMPVPVRLYLPDGDARLETAHLVNHDVDLDVALLTLDTEELVPFGARLASRERVADVNIFDQVYAVGCPLGNDPIPTAGEIAATRHAVDGSEYWMISAPTYIGNSGGGIFDAETHELLGIFSKIYTHGSMRATIVPHMGLVTPLSKVYDWLDQVGESQVVDHQAPAAHGAVQAASAERN